MKPTRLLIVLLGVLLGVVAFVAIPLADEGFWPFNNIPKAAIKQRYGFEVTDQWLKHLQRATLIGWPSGPIVSPDGLVLTNYHIGMGALLQLSTPEKDYMKDGFYAATRTEELKVPGMEVYALMSIEDVTARVNAAVRPETTPAEALGARRTAIGAIEKESQGVAGVRSEVVTLYQGGQYHLYRYDRKYSDVRLVFSPEFQTGFYGGDSDNFTYPRYSLDIAFFRLYEDGKPANTADNHLEWSPAGSTEGELVFTAGYPGSTQRLNTVAHLEYLRDIDLPYNLRLLERRQAQLKRYGALGAEQTRQAKLELFGVENMLKSYRGLLEGLKDPALMAKKTAAEKRLRDAVAADPQKQKLFGDAWDRIAKAYLSLKAYDLERGMAEGAAGLNSRLFTVARTLVRLAAERAKLDADRLAEFTDARRRQLETGLFTPTPRGAVYPEFEKAKLADSLAYMKQELGADSPLVKKALGDKTPQVRAGELIDGTKLADMAIRKELAASGQQAIEASTDPLIVLARAIDPESRVLRKRYEDEVVSVERMGYAKIAQAVLATGPNAYPDGTQTLRLSYGTVKGYREAGSVVGPYTRFAGLFERSAQHNNQNPYDLAPRWIDRKAALNLQTPFNFIMTNEVVGGSSGSPVVNTRGELVGLIFDMNIQSLPGYFIYDEAVNRGIGVDSRAIIEALRKVYGATALADEIIGKTRTRQH